MIEEDISIAVAEESAYDQYFPRSANFTRNNSLPSRVRAYERRERLSVDSIEAISLPEAKGRYNEIVFKFLISHNVFFSQAIGGKKREAFYSVEGKEIICPFDNAIYIRSYENSTKNVAVTEKEHCASILVSSLLNRLQYLKSLPPNWDSYNAHPIHDTAYSTAINLFFEIFAQSTHAENYSLPFIAPLASGGLQVEWETARRKFHFRVPIENKKWQYLTEDKLLTDSKKYSNMGTYDEIKKIIRTWLFDENGKL